MSGARGGVLISVSSRRGGSARAAAISSLSVSSEAVGGRRGAKASARALQLPQRPARCRGRALAAASVLGWPGGRARATLHQLLVMPLRDAAASSPRFFATAPLPPSSAAPLRSNDAPKPLLGTAFALFFSSATGSMIAIEALEPPPRRAAGLPWPRSTPSIHRRSLQPNFLGPRKPVP